jgi:mRNA interferase RelE/StbE
MRYQIQIEKKAAKYLEKICEPDYYRIKAAISNLADAPRPIGYKKLKDSNVFRIRSGNYRILYEIFDNVLIINIIAIGHRKDIYK